MKHQRHKDFCADSFRRAMGLLVITGAAVERYAAADSNASGCIDLAAADGSVGVACELN